MSMWRNLKQKIKYQGGFTAVELLIGVALIGIIGGAVGVGVAQTFSGSGLSNNQKTAINNVRTAGDWIVRDAQQARVKESTIVPANTESGVFVPFDPLAATPDMMMKFKWYEYYPSYSPKKWTWTEVVYVFEFDKVIDGINIYNLKRTEGVGEDPNNLVWGQSIIVAQNLIITNEVGRSLYTYQDTNTLTITFTITIASRVGSGSSVATETRTFEVCLRPKR